MLEYKGLKQVEDFPSRGLYTKIAKTIIKEFLKDDKQKAEVELEYENTRQLLSLYNAMKSLIRRNGYKVRPSIDRTKGKLYLAKEG